MARKTDKPTASFANEVPVDPYEARQCGYTSLIHGRCRFWGAIFPGGAKTGWCSGHFKHRVGPEAEQVAESSATWRREFWDVERGMLVDSGGVPVRVIDGRSEAAHLAQAMAARYGVDAELPARQRAAAIASKTGGVGGWHAAPKRERVPGEDDE